MESLDCDNLMDEDANGTNAARSQSHKAFFFATDVPVKWASVVPGKHFQSSLMLLAANANWTGKLSHVDLLTK